MQRSGLLAIGACAAVFAAGVGVAATTMGSSEDASRPSPLGPNAQRFLDLTDDQEGGALVAGGGGDTRAEGAAAAGDQAPAIEGQYTPNGFRVRPAGAQVPVFNFPLGLLATPDGSQVIASSDSGGMQGLTTIDGASLSPAYTPAANLFIGVAATDDGRVYASGGNADKVFR